VISYGTMAHQAGGAVIITASHNPGVWNGFKFKTRDGAGAPDEVTAAIEKHIARIYPGGEVKRLPLEQGLEKGTIKYLDLKPAYEKQVNKLVDLSGLKKAGLKVVVDSMYGAGSGYIKELLTGGETEIIEINGERNPLFPGIQPEPIAANLKKLSAAVRDSGADLGAATDGDADRLGIMDENGVFLTTQQVFALLALYLLEIKGERGLIVKTITATSMLYRLGEIYQVPVLETPVGFKYVAPIMMAEDAIIGGEESGGFGYRGHVPERDGVLSILYFLDLMVKTGKKPSQLIEYLYSKVGTHHYNRVDVKFPAAERPAIIERVKKHTPDELDGKKVTDIYTADGFRYTLADNSWLLVRFSGTEPLLRIYAESGTPEEVENLLRTGRKIAGV
jgi:phosphomannomutase